MIEDKRNGLSLWRFEILSSCKELLHFVSGRSGGCSPLPENALNLGFGDNDDPQNVDCNRRRLAEALGISPKSLTTAKQVHGAHVAALQRQGSKNQTASVIVSDAMVTNVSNLCLMVLVADCVPILFYDPVAQAIGAAHAGWKGTVLGVARKTVHALCERYRCRPQNIIACIGPSIGPCCYEVGPEVLRAVEKAMPERIDAVLKQKRNGFRHFDLWATNRLHLLEAGISEKHIETANICTYESPERFFSFRKSKGRTGRFGAGIMIRGGPI